MVKPLHTKTKLKRGLYIYRGWYLVATERLNNDKSLDWIAVDTKAEAERVWNGGEPKEFPFVHNGLKLLMCHLDNEL